MSPARQFNFTDAMRRLCADIVARLPEFSHVRMEQIAVSFAQARRPVQWGLQAKLTPLRFGGGALTTFRRGRLYTIERWRHGEVELLYVLTFYLPRFLDQSFREKLVTIVHELYHISPQFDGDIRRLPGHYHVHSHSQQQYDCAMGRLADRYLGCRPPEELYGFLRLNFAQIATSYGRVVGMRMPIPRLLPMPKSA